MSYLVLARKWRPKFLDDVVGQAHVARTLKNSIDQDRVAHAYLFCGSRGVGKTSTARILAKALNCERGPRPDPCYACTACKEIHAGQSVDVFEIDGASNRGINEIRELREGVRYAPSAHRYKIYIIDEVHMLTTEAFNALLKTLEEPPSHAHFIFATTEPQKIPVTILSRCQRFDFKRIGQHDIVDHLQMLCGQEDIHAERAALQLIARQANGGMRDAMSLLDQVISFAGAQIDEPQVAQILGVANRKHLFEISEAILAGSAERALMTLDEVNRYGYDLQQFASELVTHFRDLVVTRVVANPGRVTNLTERELASVDAQVADVEPNLLHRFFSVMADGAQEMTRSPYPKLIFEMTLVRMAGLEPLVGLDLLVDRLGSLERTLEDDVDLDALEARSKKKPERDAHHAPPTHPSAQPVTPEPPPAPSTPTPSPPQAPAATPPTPPSASAPAEDHADPGAEPDATSPEAPAEPPEQGAHAPPDAPAEPSATLTPAELAELDDKQRWRRVVRFLHRDQTPLAATCEHAHVVSIADGAARVIFAPQYIDYVHEGDRFARIEGAVQSVLGDHWSLVVEARQQDPAPDDLTIAEERIETLRLKQQALEQRALNHPIVASARELFEPERVHARVRLHEES